MNLCCFDNFVIKEQVHGRAGILGNNTIEAQVKGRPGGCVDAHVAHSATDDEMVHVRFSEDVQEGCIAKTVWIVFDDNRFTLAGSYPVINFCSFCARQEEESVWTDRNVLYMNDRCFRLSEFRQENPGIFCGSFNPGKFHGAAGEIIILQINHNKTLVQCNDSAGLPCSAIYFLCCSTLTVYSVNPFSFICPAFLKSAMPVFNFRNPIFS